MFKDIDPQIRTFLLVTVALSVSVWHDAFNLGAFGVIFFDKILLIWATATSVLLGLIFLPFNHAPVRWRNLVMMAIPTIWVAAAFFHNARPTGDKFDLLFWGLGAMVTLICLPYTIYVVVSIISPEFLQLEGLKIKLALMLVVLTIGLIGYWAGRNNFLFLTCEDFKISGQELPNNCYRQ